MNFITYSKKRIVFIIFIDCEDLGNDTRSAINVYNPSKLVGSLGNFTHDNRGKMVTFLVPSLYIIRQISVCLPFTDSVLSVVRYPEPSHTWSKKWGTAFRDPRSSSVVTCPLLLGRTVFRFVIVSTYGRRERDSVFFTLLSVVIFLLNFT